MAWYVQDLDQKRYKEIEVRKTESGALACLIILTCFLYLLSGCASKTAYQISSLDKPWKFIMEMDYYCFSSASGFQAGRKMATKRIVIYRYMGANITNRMGIGILGYSDCVLSHLREFDDLVDSMSF